MREILFRGGNVRQVTLDGDTLIIETDIKEPLEGCVPRFYCIVDDKEIDITGYVREEKIETAKAKGGQEND